MKLILVLVVMAAAAAGEAVRLSRGEMLRERRTDMEPPRKEWEDEAECRSVGGYCELESVCPARHRHPKGLCPRQQGSGVECCEIDPTGIKECRKQGGECVTSKVCGKSFTLDVQCPEEGVCCVFLN